jgi:hypothetical protein
LESDLLWPLPRGKNTSLEVQAAVRQRAQRVSRLQVDEVFKRLGCVQLRLGWRTPTVRLGTQILDLGNGLRRAQKRRHIGW